MRMSAGAAAETFLSTRLLLDQVADLSLLVAAILAGRGRVLGDRQVVAVQHVGLGPRGRNPTGICPADPPWSYPRLAANAPRGTWPTPRPEPRRRRCGRCPRSRWSAARALFALPPGKARARCRLSNPSVQQEIAKYQAWDDGVESRLDTLWGAKCDPAPMCSTDDDCLGSEVCSDDGFCSPECKISQQCGSGQVCVDGVCVDTR